MKKNLILNNFGFFPSLPPYSTSYISGLLRGNGLHVKHIDSSLILWEKMLSNDYLKNLTFIEERVKENPLPFCPPLQERTFDVMKNNVATNIESALDVFKKKELFYDIDKLLWACHLVFQAQQLIYHNYGTFITNKIIFWPKLGIDVNSIQHIYKYSSDRTHNPLIPLIESELLPIIKEYSPDVIGIDIIFPWEIIQALTITTLIKKHFPNIHLNLLGYGFDEFCYSRIADRLKSNDKLFFGFDSIFMVKNDDELAHFYSLDNFSAESLRTVKSLAFKENDCIEMNGPLQEGRINYDIIPDYTDLPLDRYFTPELTFVEKLSSKCYWSKCSYCNINSYKNHSQETPIKTFMRRIKNYSENYGCTRLFILDEAVRPEMAEELAKELMAEKIDLIWSIRTRVDEEYNRDRLQLLHNAGCRELWIGLEAVSPRLLKEMNKTDHPDKYASVATQIMKDSSEIGIGLHFCLILGFPTEQEADRKELYLFFERNHKFISKIPFFATFNFFNLNSGTDVYANYEKYDISEIIEHDDIFGMINIPFKLKNSTMSTKEREEKIEFFADTLTDIFVKNDMMKLLWFFAAESPWELLLKSHFSQENPFQKSPRLADRAFVKIYAIIERYPSLLNLWNNFINKKMIETKSQIYR